LLSANHFKSKKYTAHIICAELPCLRWIKIEKGKNQCSNVAEPFLCIDILKPVVTPNGKSAAIARGVPTTVTSFVATIESIWVVKMVRIMLDVFDNYFEISSLPSVMLPVCCQ
jgi:hypothetical protein